MRTRWIFAAVVVLLAVIQVIPVTRSNPPVESDVDAPTAVKALLRRACYDCHSHETRWPAYARVAPASWLVASDVSEGRAAMDLSRWRALDAKGLQNLARKIPEDLGEGEMPPLTYRLAHREARLTDAEKATLVEWARSLGK